jgi:hypothetical protein
MTTIEAAARAMTKPERAARLRACGWQRTDYGGVQSWRPPDPDEHHAWWTLAAAIREQLRRDRRAALPHINRIPVVPLKREVTIGRDRVWVIDCPYCGREHTHGAEPGHRVSHCRHHGSGPGYIIEHLADDEGWLLAGEVG